MSEEKQAPNYYSIIPADVRYHKELRPNEKLLYGELTALTNSKGFCWASNQYFAELYGVSKETVSRWIANLEKFGFVTREIIRDDKNVIISRRIYIAPSLQNNQDVLTQGNENPEPLTKMSIPSLQYNQTPIDKKVKENNTSINNTSMNRKILSSSDEHDDPPLHDQVISYLNNQAYRQFKSTTKKTKSLIRARANEGFNLDDFKTVIDKKVAEWKDDSEMQKYIRPETLFGTKFEGYLNQDAPKKSKQEGWYERDEYARNFANPRTVDEFDFGD